MRIGVIGTPNRIEELNNKVSSSHELVEVKNNQFEDYDLIMDLTFDDFPERIDHYASLTNKIVVVSAAKYQIEAAVSKAKNKIECVLFGMNTLPSFINRELAEVCSLNASERSKLEEKFEALDWRLKWVESRVGLVTPRIILMIINEAYYTVQEGTASKEDIDVGMKLGTAYPKGPFEWVKEIGVNHVYEVLEAMYMDTHDERYKVCPLLKTEYLQNTVVV